MLTKTTIIDSKESKNATRKAIILNAIDTLITNTACERVVDSSFADEFISETRRRINNQWDYNRIVITGLPTDDDKDTLEFNPNSLRDMAKLLYLITEYTLIIGEKVEFEYDGMKAEGFETGEYSDNAKLAFVTNTEWGSDDDMYL